MDTDRPNLDPVSVTGADPADAAGIAAVHVAVWRSAYAGILPPRVLLRLSEARLARQYGAAIARGGAALVARAAGGDVVGFTTFSAGPAPLPGSAAPRTGEVETLYVHDDWRERGIGRRLLRGAAGALRAEGCGALHLHVLAENGSRWFYAHLGGRAAQSSVTWVGGVGMAQVTMVWDRIESLADGR